MPKVTKVELSEVQQCELEGVRDRHPKAYMRERASAVLKAAGGESARQVALRGANPIIAVDTNVTKLELAREFGATHALLADGSTLDAIRNLTGGRGADYVFEAIGLPDVQERLLEYARLGGELVLVGISPMGTTTNFPSAILTRQEKVVRGSYYGTIGAKRDFPMILDLYVEGKIKLDELISKEYTLEQVNEAFESMLTGNVARGVIVY